MLDSSVLIATERRKLRPAEAVRSVHQRPGETPIVLSAMSVAEIGQGIYRATTEEQRVVRRNLLNELKATIPVHAFTAATAGIVARIGGEHAARGINLPIADLITAASAMEIGYAVGTANLRHFRQIAGLQVV